MSVYDAERDQRQWLEKALGIRMTPEQIHTWAGALKSGTTDDVVHEAIYMPLLSQMKGKEYYEALAKTVALPGGKKMGPNVYMGDYKKEEGEEIVSLANQPKGDWMKFLSKTGVYGPEVMAHMKDRREERESDPDYDVDREMKDRERKKDLSDVSKEEHMQRMRHATGSNPTVPKTDKE